MNSDNYSSEPETDDVLLENEEENMSSGNRKLGLIVGAVVLLAGLGYAFVPGKTGRAPIASVMPSVMLGDATVTGDRPADEQAAATAEAAAAKPEEAKKAGTTAAVAARPVARPVSNAPGAATAATAAQPAAAPVAEEVAAPAPAAPAEPANVTLSGRILDEEGKPMAGATVMLKGSRKVASTDANGNYSMEVPAGDNTLTYGYGGYQDQEMRARGSQPVNVTLVPKEGAKRRRK